MSERVTITLEDRADGGLRVYSDDMPGLILDGSDRDQIMACVLPAIDAIRKYKAEAELLTEGSPQPKGNM